MAKNESFSDLELASMDTLIRRLQAVDKSAQSMNTKLQRIIDQNEVAIAPQPKQSLENPAVSKDQPKEPQQEKSDKPIEPVNVTKEEDLFFSEPLVEPVAPAEKETEIEKLPILNRPPVIESKEVKQLQVEKNIEPKSSEKQEPAIPVVNNIENTNIITADPVYKEEENITEAPPVEPITANLPVQETKIIEKAIPVVNTVEKLKEPDIKTSDFMPTVSEKPEVLATTNKVEPTPVKAERIPPPPVTFNVISEAPQQPTVNVNTEPTAIELPFEKPTTEIPQTIPTAPALPVLVPEPEIKDNTISKPVDPFNIPPVAELPAATPIDVLASEPKMKEEIPPVTIKPEVLKSDESLNLADESLVEINKNINTLTEIFKQGQTKLATSVDSLNNTVAEILKMLPTLQAGDQSSGPLSRKNREDKIDAANLISSYRQSLGLQTRSYTQNTVFPGGNSIA